MASRIISIKHKFGLNRYAIIYAALFSYFLVNVSSAFCEEGYVFQSMWPALKQPWYFYEPTSVAIDDDQYVYVANNKSDNILKFTSQGEFVTKWGKNGEDEGHFNSPFDIAPDNMGFVYVSDMNNHRIQKFTSNGQFVFQWGNQGKGIGEFSSPHGIAVDINGYVYVADTKNNRIQVFSSHGLFTAVWEHAGSQGNFDFPQDITVTYDGFAYVADTGNDRILKFDLKGTLINYWGTTGDGNGSFHDPHGIASDHEGNVYVTYKFNYQIQKFDSDGVLKKIRGGLGNEDGLFDISFGIAVDKNGFIYVADMNNQRIQKFTTNGQHIAVWGPGSKAGYFNTPKGIAISKDGFVYVADTENDRIQKFTLKGELELSWGQHGDKEREFNNPMGVALDSKGNVYVTDKSNNRIQKFTPDGKFISQWGQEGTQDGSFDWPYGITVDKYDHVYVVDWNNNRIQKFSADGLFITKWGKPGSGQGEFAAPYGIAVDHNDFVYVVDASNWCVQKFTSEGKFVEKWGNKDSESGIFKTPFGIAVKTIEDSDFIYVADSGNSRIQKFTDQGDFITKWGESGHQPGQMNYPGALSIAPDGNIYVADTDNHRVQVFNKSAEPMNQKAIIVAGGGPFTGNKLWDVTQMCANNAYYTLTYRGIGNENIRYLSSNTGLDLNNDGEPDTVKATNDNLKYEIQQCAVDTDMLILYLVDHGGNETFLMNHEEKLEADFLAQCLDNLQTNHSCQVVFIYDACNSGSFYSALSPYDKRVVITSTSPDQNAWFISQGAISFSNYFWTNIFNCYDIQESFKRTKTVIQSITNKQIPLINTETTAIIGSCTVQNNAPEISNQEKVYHGEKSASFSANVTDNDGIGRVWGVIVPPNDLQAASDLPLLKLPSVELMPATDISDVYTGRYDYFETEGDWNIFLHASDSKGNISVSDYPVQITMGNSLRRKAIIIAPGADEKTGEYLEHAYNAFRFQGYSDEDIYLLCSVTNLCDNLPRWENVQAVVDGWAGENTQDIVIYMIGKGEYGNFLLNDMPLQGETLGNWLDNLQSKINGIITVIYDADYSGSFLSYLTPGDKSKKRIIISSTSADRTTSDNISFSELFWRDIHSGESVGKAFNKAKSTLGFFTGSFQDSGPQMDDTRNGIGNEFSDGRLAMSYTIGIGAGTDMGIQSGIIFSENNDSRSSGKILKNGEQSAEIWVKDIEASLPIKEIVAAITPPDYNDSSLQIPLSLVGDGRYEGIYVNFSKPGLYKVAVFVTDEKNNSFIHGTTWVYQISGMDMYENDDDFIKAGFIVVSDETQYHTLHKANDKDWMKFYAYSETTYAIKISNPEFPDGNGNTLINLYDTDHKTILKQANESFDWQFEKDDLYYISISHDNSFSFEISAYGIEIYPPIGVFPGYLKGIITDLKGNPVSGAKVTADLVSVLSRPSGRYRIVREPADDVDIKIEADGYHISQEHGVIISEGGTTIKNYILEPLIIPSSEDDKQDNCPEDLNKTEPGICGCGVSDIDSDNDGTADCNDFCPYDSDKIAPGMCGCGVADADKDHDGKADCNDMCPDDPKNKCEAISDDIEKDENQEQHDTCPDDLNKTEPGVCGCGEADIDTDNDGVPDCKDNCPKDPFKTNPGICGCGIPDTDTDQDKIPDCNDKPRQPALLLPNDRAENISLTPILKTESFSHMIDNHSHAETQWQISLVSDFSSLILDIADQNHLVSLPVPESVLEQNTRYFWRVRFRDNKGVTTEWSFPSSFTTIPVSDDKNSDGVPDVQEVKDSTDMDNNGISDREQKEIRVIKTIIGDTQISIKIVSETASFESVRSSKQTTLLKTERGQEDMPVGYISVKLKTENYGNTCKVAVYFSDNLPESAIWRYKSVNGWNNFFEYVTLGDDRKALNLTFKDGGFGDTDGAENGIIVSLFGYSIKRTMMSPIPQTEDISSSGGCFIITSHQMIQ
ncbi:NHL repeat-containing protein [Desulfonema limicola]|uniref:NHL repeat-containing protein n=1 Tax=Desulfonema limicola TaxID=45656 RepID=A0A975BES0_9BACT|nr:SMP-30/gluconolactonase/LRE family protein [Desulfonema limicola]QTA83814.1 NHL repeat-containing protein [Desulfonema limicola]